MGFIGEFIGSTGGGGGPTIRAPLIIERSSSGDTTIAIGDTKLGQYSTVGKPVGGFLGEAAPYIVLGQQLALAAVLPGAALAAGNLAQTLATATRDKMALNVGALLGAVGQAAGGVSGSYGQLVSAGANIASAFFQPQAPAMTAATFAPVYQIPAASQPTYGTTVAQKNLPAVSGGGGRGMSQEIFGAASRMLASLGFAPKTVGSFMSATRRAMSSLASLARRTPAGTLISLLVGLGLAVNEANQLAGWWATTGKRRRRINPTNVHALRRSLRRISSFEKLASRVHRGEGKICRTRGRRRSSCGTCRKTPCRC